MGDAEVLDRAAVILRARSTKPHSFLVNVVCRVLTRTAERIRAVGG